MCGVRRRIYVSYVDTDGAEGVTNTRMDQVRLGGVASVALLYSKADMHRTGRKRLQRVPNMSMATH